MGIWRIPFSGNYVCTYGILYVYTPSVNIVDGISPNDILLYLLQNQVTPVLFIRGLSIVGKPLALGDLLFYFFIYSVSEQTDG